MATSLESQLKAIASTHVQVEDLKKRPFTRPSILFNPTEAADVSLESVYDIALRGLDELSTIERSFATFKKTLFNSESLQIDRELQNREYNAKLDKSIATFLHLLSGYLLLAHSHKTLEYLIRRYKIYAYNVDDVILCALPYHETSLFVRIVQLLNLEKTQWHFLEGVKKSGAPPPRAVLVKQCTCVTAVLETICEYNMPVIKSRACPKSSISFCVAVIIETLGAVKTVDTDLVNKVLPFILYCFDPLVGQDYKVGGLMIVGTLVGRAALSEKLVQKLICSVARGLQKDADKLEYVSLLQMSLMALIKLTQEQTIKFFPWKALEVLSNISDFPVILSELSKTFHMENFLSLILDGLIYHSFSHKSCQNTFITIIDTVPMKSHIVQVVSKILGLWTGKVTQHDIPEARTWTKQVLLEVEKHYPDELDKAICDFLENFQETNKQSLSGAPVFEILRTVFNGSLHVPIEESNASLCVSLEHPKAEIRAAAVSSLATFGILETTTCDMKTMINIQEALLRRLHDDDLSVVLAVLSLDSLARVVDTTPLLKALSNILSRCYSIMRTGSKGLKEQAYGVANLCLEFTVSNFLAQNPDCLKEVATLILPNILILPKTWKLNQKALQLAGTISWPLFNYLSRALELMVNAQNQKPAEDWYMSINMKIVRALSDALIENLETCLPWLIKCCRESGRAKSLLYLILIHSFMQQREAEFWPLLKGCLPFLKQEWSDMDSEETVIQIKPKEIKTFFCQPNLYKHIESENQAVRGNLLIAIFWSLLKNIPKKSFEDSNNGCRDKMSVFEDLFVLFAMSSSKKLLKEHIHLIVTHSTLPAVPFLSNFFMEEGSAVPVKVQVESLNALTSLCLALPRAESSERNGMQGINAMQLQLALPCILVALSSAVQAVRRAATECIQALNDFFQGMETSSQKNGTEPLHERYIPMDVFEEFVESILQLKEVFGSDGNFLSPFLRSILNSSSVHISVPDNLCKRFDERKKEAILLFILTNALEFPTYAKCTLLSVIQEAGHVAKQVAKTKPLLSDLLLRRKCFHLKYDLSQEKMSYDEVQLLCVLLKTYMLHIDSSPNSAKESNMGGLEPIFEALFVEGISPEDPAGIKPCILVLENISSSFYDSQAATLQDQLFQRLIILFSSDIGVIRNAASDALRRINVNGITVAKQFDSIIAHFHRIENPTKKLKKRKLEKSSHERRSHGGLPEEGWHLSFAGALLEFLVWKKDLNNRLAVIEPLFRLLGKTIEDGPLISGVHGEQETGLPDNSHGSRSDSKCYLQQVLLTVLENISNSLLAESDLKEILCKKFNVDLVVRCVNIAKDSTTRNHALSLMTALGRLLPDQVLDHVIDIFTIMGKSTIIQDDSHSQKVSEQLISAVVPCWLMTTKDPKKLLKVFVNALPQMSQHRRLAIMKHLLGVVGEEASLPVLLLLLIEMMVSRTLISTQKAQNLEGIPLDSKWEIEFSVQLSGQYPSRIWLPALVKLLQGARTDAYILDLLQPECKGDDSFLWTLQIEATSFITNYLRNSELAFELEIAHDEAALQEALGALMEQVVLQLQIIDRKTKKPIVPSGLKNDAREAAYSLLNTVTKLMVPSAYSKGITSLLKHSDANVCEKALRLLCENLKDKVGLVQQPRMKRKMVTLPNAQWHSLGEESDEAFKEMIMEIVELLKRSPEDSSVRAKIAAVATLDVLAKKFVGNFPSTFSDCLSPVVANLTANDVALSSGCLNCIASFVTELGPQALAHLPHIIKYILKKTWQVCLSSFKEATVSKMADFEGNTASGGAFLISVLSVLEAIVQKLGGFLNPYLEEIVGLLVLHSQFTTDSGSTVCTKAASIRILMSEKISVRLLLDPIVRVYGKAVENGEASVSAIFEMLAVVASKMDRPSVVTYHAKIFESCLIALDLRRQHPESIKNMGKVEASVINALVALIMKLSEATFKPLFVRSLDWAESEVESYGTSSSRNIQRNISFYNFIDSLTGKLRSVFVPYFQYLMDGCVHHLTGGQDHEVNVQAKHKRKKSKLTEKVVGSETKQALTESEWNLRMLVISSLHKCFLYDTVGFLDSSKFQILLKPIVSQLVVDPPKSVGQLKDVPSIEQVDDTLVSCLGQMALTAGTDLLWKPLNHEVLMQTRSEKVRARILSLRVVKYLLEHLKEEYLVLLPETIPFLGELLEDSELGVVAQAQEILKSMEDLSGESLSQYL